MAVIRIANRQFSPGLWPSLVTLILLPVLVSLGFWQLDRAEEKRHIQQQYEQRLALPAMNIRHAVDFERLEPWRKVQVSGHFAQKQFLLDNQVHARRVGYHVLTPLRVEGSQRYVLVNRGWVAAPSQRQELPEYETATGQLRVTGMLREAAVPGMKLADHAYQDKNWPIVLQWLDLNELEELSGFDFIPYVLYLNKADPNGFVREWKIINSLPEKSTSYAIQWFSLAVALLLIYIFVNSRKIKTHE